jgi:hypothetical protein
MSPKVRPGEIVTLAGGEEAVVAEIEGPNEAGTGWNVTVRLGGARDGDSLVALGEDALEPTGLEEDERGKRVPLGPQPTAADCIELRLFTEITDGIDAARVASEIEEELVEVLGEAAIATEAERHWSEPYNYELAVTIVPAGEAVEALRTLAAAGEGGWLALRDDGWRCELWWSSTRDPDAILIVPEVHAAELALIPWSDPARRPENDRPVVTVALPDGSDAEAGDEEA